MGDDNPCFAEKNMDQYCKQQILSTCRDDSDRKDKRIDNNPYLQIGAPISFVRKAGGFIVSL